MLRAFAIDQASRRGRTQITIGKIAAKTYKNKRKKLRCSGLIHLLR